MPTTPKLFIWDIWLETGLLEDLKQSDGGYRFPVPSGVLGVPKAADTLRPRDTADSRRTCFLLRSGSKRPEVLK
jgi:hypothetical protein